MLGCVCAAAAPTETAILIKDTRPNIKKYDNGFVMEDTHMGHPNGKVRFLISHECHH